MNLINPIMFDQPQQNNIIKKEESLINGSNMGVDFSFFTSGNSAKIAIDTPTSDQPTPKRGRPAKKTKTMSDGSEMVPADDNNLPKYQTNEPYKDTYQETDGMLRTAINQIDILSNDIKSDIDDIRASKTLRKKYDYISELTGTSGTLLGNKISAIREMNKTITDSHNLEIRRTKELKLGVDEVDDDRKIMDLYNAFISTPVGSYDQLGPSIIDMNSMTGNIIRADISSNGTDTGYSNYLNNLSPAQNRMRFENDPNVQTVVVFNQETGQRFFDVVDKATGSSIPNISKPDSFLLEDVSINVNSGIARNTNLDITYPLVIIGGNNAIMEY